MNNWEFTLSRKRSILEATEEFSDAVLKIEFRTKRAKRVIVLLGEVIPDLPLAIG